jgi:hypothetical protein
MEAQAFNEAAAFASLVAAAVYPTLAVLAHRLDVASATRVAFDTYAAVELAKGSCLGLSYGAQRDAVAAAVVDGLCVTLIDGVLGCEPVLAAASDVAQPPTQPDRLRAAMALAEALQGASNPATEEAMAMRLLDAAARLSDGEQDPSTPSRRSVGSSIFARLVSTEGSCVEGGNAAVGASPAAYSLLARCHARDAAELRLRAPAALRMVELTRGAIKALSARRHAGGPSVAVAALGELATACALSLAAHEAADAAPSILAELLRELEATDALIAGAVVQQPAVFGSCMALVCAGDFGQGHRDLLACLRLQPDASSLTASCDALADGAELLEFATKLVQTAAAAAVPTPSSVRLAAVVQGLDEALKDGIGKSGGGAAMSRAVVDVVAAANDAGGEATPLAESLMRTVSSCRTAWALTSPFPEEVTRAHTVVVMTRSVIGGGLAKLRDGLADLIAALPKRADSPAGVCVLWPSDCLDALGAMAQRPDGLAGAMAALSVSAPVGVHQVAVMPAARDRTRASGLQASVDAALRAAECPDVRTVVLWDEAAPGGHTSVGAAREARRIAADRARTAGVIVGGSRAVRAAVSGTAPGVPTASHIVPPRKKPAASPHALRSRRAGRMKQ